MFHTDTYYKPGLPCKPNFQSSCKITHNFDLMNFYDLLSIIIDNFPSSLLKHNLKFNKIADYF